MPFSYRLCLMILINSRNDYRHDSRMALPVCQDHSKMGSYSS